jgi:UDP:flavonoid glycosyltransferase YjiC (YdhE family)
VTKAFKAQRVAVGLPAGETSYFDVLAPDLFLQPTIPELEYPRSDLPPQVRFVGPLVPPNAGTGELPAWWPDVEAAKAAGRPIILVTQGTMATNPKELIAPALEALANEDVLVVATTGATEEQLGFAPPKNARLAAYVPYQALLPHTAVMVTNGGYGGVQMALAHAVPMVVAGGSEEKPEIAARVAWAGVGVDLRTGRPRAKNVLRAVKRILDEKQFKARATELAAACARHDAVTEAVSAIEALGKAKEAA